MNNKKVILDEELSKKTETKKQDPSRSSRGFKKRVKRIVRWIIFFIIIAFLAWYYTINPKVYHTVFSYTETYTTQFYRRAKAQLTGEKKQLPKKVVKQIKLPIEDSAVNFIQDNNASITDVISKEPGVLGKLDKVSEKPEREKFKARKTEKTTSKSIKFPFHQQTILEDDNELEEVLPEEQGQEDLKTNIIKKTKKSDTFSFILGDYDIEVLEIPEGETLILKSGEFKLKIMNIKSKSMTKK